MQSFQPSYGNVTGVEIRLNQGPGLTFKVGLFDFLPITGATPLAEGTVTTQTSGTAQFVAADWEKVSVTPGQTYYFGYCWVGGSQNSVAGASGNPYANGLLYGLGGALDFDGDFDLTFKTFSDACATPQEAIIELINAVISLNLKQGISNALDSKLENALSALEDANINNDASTTNLLNAFRYSVNAQRGIEISDIEADSLIDRAQAIIDSLSE